MITTMRSRIRWRIPITIHGAFLVSHHLDINHTTRWEKRMVSQRRICNGTYTMHLNIPAARYLSQWSILPERSPSSCISLCSFMTELGRTYSNFRQDRQKVVVGENVFLGTVRWRCMLIVWIEHAVYRKYIGWCRVLWCIPPIKESRSSKKRKKRASLPHSLFPPLLLIYKVQEISAGK